MFDPIACGSDGACRLSDEDVAKVNALNCDILVKLGEDKLEGAILSASRLGTISLECGDNRIIGRRAPAGFWEWYFKWPRTGFTIQRSVADKEHTEVLARGFYRTQSGCLLNRELLRKKAGHHVRDLLARIADTGCLPECETSVARPGTLLEHPALQQAVLAFAKLAYRYCWSKTLEFLHLRDRWGISVLRSSWRDANLRESVAARTPPGRAWCTPFLHSVGARTYCFIEDDDFRNKPTRSRITVLEITGHGVIELGACLDEPFHLAFPFLFTFQGNLYMCPESSEANDIRVYRCVEFPLRWELCAVIMEGIAAVNTMLFPHAGKWWMLTNLDRSGAGDSCSELYLYSAVSPLGSDWVPHPRNPVRIDSYGGRNAGLVSENGKIFRLGQHHTYDQYGAGVVVFEIQAISASEYAEHPVAEIDPGFRKGVHGIHHWSTISNTTVFDHVTRSMIF